MSKPIHMINDPKLIKKLAVKEFDHFTDHRHFFDESMDTLFGNSLFFMRGQKWRDMRSTLSPAFTGSKMKHMFPSVVQVIPFVYCDKVVDKNKAKLSLSLR